MSSKPIRNVLSIKQNFLFNALNSVTGILFPLIAFPYAARILFSDGIGQVQFLSSIIGYITLFTSLGIPLYAVREIAKVRNNEKLLSRTALEILILNAMLMFLGYLVVAIFIRFVSKIQANIPLFLILSLSILLNTIGCEWFYRGIEDFRYITIRNFIARSISLALLFLLVKTHNDILWYGTYTTIGVSGGYIFNFFRLRKSLDFDGIRLKDLSPMKHLKPSFHIFLLNLTASIYIYLNTIMLGFMTDDNTVGYYTGATKITQITLGIITSLGFIMIPRLSNLISLGKKEEFNRLANKSIEFVIGISLPLTVGLIILAPTLVRLICGDMFEPSILVLQIIAPITFFIALSNVIGIQILYPQGQENTVILSTLVGASVGLILNLLLIPGMAQVGTAISTVLAECSVALTQLTIGGSFLSVKFFTRSHGNYFLGTILMGIGVYGISLLHLPDKVNIVIIPIVGIVIYGIFLLVRKDLLCLEVISSLRNKILRK